MDIVGQLRHYAKATAKATQMMADAKSSRNEAAGDVGASYRGLRTEETVEWKAADEIERLREQLGHAVPAIEQLTAERELYRTRWLASEVDLRLALQALTHEQSKDAKP